jgi:hypothetical protein|nr:MAG TPA: baseplate protein [Caudoviricetes sp.]
MVSYLDQDGVQHLVNKMRDRMYPVDSIYISTNSTSPASLYGGSWERYGKGRTLVSVNESDTDFTAGKTGGSKTHEVRVRLGNIYGLAGVSSKNNLSGISVDGGKTYSGFTNFNGRQAVESARGMDGSFGPMQVEYYAAIGNLPTLDPYVSVYIWRRTA